MLGSQIITKISHSLNIGSQVASVSHSTLLNSRVEFVASESEHSMTIHALQSKYHQLGAPTSVQESSSRLNGQYKLSPGKTVKESHALCKEENGMPIPRVVLYSPYRVQLEWKQSCRIGAGLVNLGNTCFMNTVIQCLTYCTPLANYLLHEEEHTLKCKMTGFCMLCEMQKHMKRALDKHGQAIKPMYIYQKLKSIAKHFQFGRQEDAHEFLRYVVDNLWKSCLSSHDGGFRLDPASKETTVVNQIFGGYNRSQVICLRCHGESNTFDHFMDLILDIKNVTSLQSALEKFVQTEMLEDDNAYKCPKCGIKVRAEKKFTVHKPPNVATFQFKRFDYNRMFGGKITKAISYPEKLDLRPFMSETEGPAVMYKLNSVLVHMGNTCNSGHYYCYVRNSNGCWYLMDDTRVHQVSLDQVLQQQAYVLFYVRVPSRPQECLKKPTPSTCRVSTPLKSCGSTDTPLALPSSTLSPSLLQNGSSRKPNTLKPREKISFGICRPSTPTNGFQLPNTSSTNSAKTLVPYGGDSSESSEEEKSCKMILNGTVPNGLAPPYLPKNSSDYQKSDVLKGEFEPPNKCDRSQFVTSAASRLKAMPNWHVVDSNLQSPSIASGSSNNSINSTTDWSIIDQEMSAKSKERVYSGWSVLGSKGIAESTNGKSAQGASNSILENGDGHTQRTNFSNGGSFSSGELKDTAVESNGTVNISKVNGVHSSCDREEYQTVDNSYRVKDHKNTWRCSVNEQSRGGHKRYQHKTYGKEGRWQQRSQQWGRWNGSTNSGKPYFYETHRKDRQRHGSGTSNSSYEMEWIEKTKETVEQEKQKSGNYHLDSGKNWEGNIRSKHRNDHGAYKQIGNRWDGSRHSDTVNELLRTSSQGYGNGVCTWDGGRSWMDEEPMRKRHFSDDYDDEYDKGKVRKERKRYSDSYVDSSGANPFQRFQNTKSKRNPYGGFNSFQEKHSRWNHSQGRYHNNRGYGGFHLRHYNNRHHHH